MAEEIKKTEAVAEVKPEVVAEAPKAESKNPNGADRNVAPDKFHKVAEHARQDNRRQGGDRNRRDRRGDRKEEPKQYEEQTIAIDRVARVVKGGRRFRFKALVVVGDRKNKVGVGVSKGQDVQQAVAKATDVAKKNMITVPIVNGTIPHEVEVKLTGARVLLKPAAPGTGIIAGGVVRTVLGTIGVTNLLSKSLGSSNKVNIAYATIKALDSLVPREEWIGNKSNKPKAISNKPATKETK
jgi:small subunit ribosomal protein S5